MTTVSTYTPPEIPSKWDIIPIHNSDRGAFKRCRRYWDWSSPARNNLTLRADIHGVNRPMWFGTGIHYAVEQYYNPVLKRDPVEAFITWFDIQWEGGVVTEDWLDKVYDLKPKPITDPAFQPSVDDPDWAYPTYQVRGLKQIMPDPDHIEFDQLRTLGIEMMKFYKQYAVKHDDFDVVVVEHQFSVPIWDYDNDCVLTRTDVREDSPNYGETLEVHARGRTDAAILRHGADRFGLLDHKTAEKVGDDYFAGMEMNEQALTYAWAFEMEASYYGLPHAGKSVEEVVFNVLRKAYPKSPTELKTGAFSVNRTEESTTYDILMDWIKRNMPGVPLNEKQQSYVNWLRDVGDEQFIIRHPVRFNRAQIKNAGYRMYLEALDMLEKPRIYPNITNDWRCVRCQFRTPCLATEDGMDVEQIINDNYASNKDR